ncbi:MAG: hypothetical protein WCT11_03475 [Candidatus Magasanikbacteria bacterium]
MHTVKILQPTSTTLVAQLSSLYQTFKGVKQKDAIEFDFSNLNFISPLLILPLCAYLNESKSSIIGTTQHTSYLSAIKFPKGIDTINSFQQQLQFAKNFVPISVLKKDYGADRERLETQFATMVNKIIGSIKGSQSAIYHPITELVTNIFDHSKKDRGYIFGQYYPNKKFLDICIVDCGRGLSCVYKEEEGLELNDEEAIIEVMKGNSTKPGKERGFGVRTSKKVICEALGGEFILISGNTALISDKGRERIVSLPEFYWQGVIISYRIPQPHGVIDIYPYLE